MDMKKKRVRGRFLLLVLACLLASCATTGRTSRARVTQCPERMFWRIDGVDRKGRPATVYVQGSFHLGDERLYPLEAGVVAAWQGADRLVAEIASADYGLLEAKVTDLMMASYRQAAGRIVTDGLTAGQNATLARYLDGELLETFARFEPWVTTYSLANAIYVNSGLAAEMGLDTVLLAAAQEEGRTVEGLDDLQVQLDGITYGSYDEQLAMLQDLLDDLRDPSAALAEVKSLYDAYLADDRQAVDLLNTGSMDEDRARHPFYEGYYRLLISERNRDWAKDITAYLREGGTTFIFAGAAHWVGDDSVFSYLRTMGTIE